MFFLLATLAVLLLERALVLGEKGGVHLIRDKLRSRVTGRYTMTRRGV